MLNREGGTWGMPHDPLEDLGQWVCDHCPTCASFHVPLSCAMPQEPLEDLRQWSVNDTLEYYRRARGYLNFSYEKQEEFHAWKDER